MKLSKILLLLIIPLVVVTLFGSGISSVSTVLLGIKGTITDGNLIKFSGVAGVGEDAGVAALNVTKNKFDATTAPTVNNDVDEGYTVGSKWYDVTADKGYVSLDVTDGVAVWIEITSLGTTTFTGLTDTPANYTGEGGKYVKVNVGEDALEFGTVAGEANTASNVGAQVEIYKQKTGVDLELRTLKANSNKVTVDTTPATLDIGAAAIDRSDSLSFDYTAIDRSNPASESGTIKKVEIWASSANLENCEVATFYEGDPGVFSTRDTEFIGTVTFGSKQTFDVNLNVEVGDTIGIYFTAGYLERCTEGMSVRRASGDQIPCTDVVFGTFGSCNMSLHGIGDDTPLDYIKFDIVETEMDVLNLLSTTTVAFNADADTTLYTVPTGKRCVLSHAIVVAAGDAGATTTVSIGQNTAETDFVPANTLSNLDAEYDSVILMPIPNTTPLKIKSYAAATVIEAQVASQSGAAGNTIYLFGILY